MRYEYAQDGRVAQTALVRMWDAEATEYGPERFVVQYIYDKAGRLVRKVVRDNSVQDSAVRYETSYEFDGMGRMTRERVLKRVEESGVERMNVLEDKRTTYDLGNNPTEVKHYDNVGWVYTETRTYARGYQLVDFSTQAALGVSVSTSGSYTYDTNNNLTGTKKLDVKRGATQLAYRAQWTFAYDRNNRLKSHTNTNASNVRGNLWYDGRGRVWQRWNDNSSTEDWDATLKRFVYDGGALVQEHEFDVAEVEDEWVYTYSDLTRDYLRHAAGVRQRERSGGNDTDYYLEADSGALEFKTERNPVSEAIARTERTASLNQISGATFSATVSNLATSANYIEMYGGGTSGASAGFDALLHRGSRHYLTGMGRRTKLGTNGSPGSFFFDSVPSPGVGGGIMLGDVGISERVSYDVSEPPEFDPGPATGKGYDHFANDPEAVCPQCCIDALSGGLPWNIAWCINCCGAHVDIYAPVKDCANQPGGPWTIAKCRMACCSEYPHPEAIRKDVTAWFLDYCLLFEFDLNRISGFLDWVKSLERWIDVAEFILCMYETGGNWIACLIEQLGPDIADFAELINLILSAVSQLRLGTDCCGELKWLFSVQDKELESYQCCLLHYQWLANNILNMSRWTIDFECCLYCPEPDNEWRIN